MGGEEKEDNGIPANPITSRVARLSHVKASTRTEAEGESHLSARVSHMSRSYELLILAETFERLMDGNGLEKPTVERWELKTLRVQKKRQGPKKRL